MPETDDVNCLVPPPTFVIDCIRKLNRDRASATLVLSEWKSAPVCENHVYNTDTYILPFTGAVEMGNGNNGIFGEEPLSFR